MRCYQNGRRNVVVPKASSAEESTWIGLATYAWSGSVLECPVCGVIYRSRQHWYGKSLRHILKNCIICKLNFFLKLLGNETPEGSQIVHTEISHIWPGIRTLQGTLIK